MGLLWREIMGSSKKQRPCKECIEKCLWKHEKLASPSSSSVSPTCIPNSFFKVMLGDFTQYLFIPPKFAQTIGGLIQKNIYIKDCTESIWMVKLSVVDGSLAFHYGWHDFALAHSVSVGEMLTFKHTSSTYFSVHIYGTSGSERVHFDKDNSDYRKRKRTSYGIFDGKEVDYESSEDSEEKHDTIGNPAKKDRVGKTNSSDFAMRNYVVNGERHRWNSLHKNLHRNRESGSSQSPSSANYPKAKKINIAHVSKEAKEAGRKSKIILVDDESDDEATETTKTKKASKSKGIQKAEEHGKDRENLGSSDRLISNYFLTKERKSCSAEKYLLSEQEVINVSPINSVRPEAFHQVCNSQDTKSLLMNEVNLSHHNDNPKSTKTEFAVSDMETQIGASWAIVKYPANEEVMLGVGISREQDIADEDVPKNNVVQDIGTSQPEVIFSKVDGDQVVDNCNGTVNCVEDKGTGYKHSAEDGETCFNADEDVNHKLEENKNASIDMCDVEKKCCEDKIGIVDKTSSPHETNEETVANAPTLNCTRDCVGSSTPARKAISSLDKSKGNYGSEEVEASPTGPAADLHCAVVDFSGSDSLQNVTKENSSKRGFVPDKVQEGCDKTFTLCPKIVPGIVKTEPEDMTDIPSPSYANFRITVSVISQFWLLLPERLPARLSKKRHERRVVVLCDPSEKVWPVLYHESLSFRGFIAGWEEFAAKNDLQQGDTCEIESADDSEQPMFLVRIIRKAPKPA